MSKSNEDREKYRSEKAERVEKLQQTNDKWLRQEIYKDYLRRKPFSFIERICKEANDEL